MVSWKLCVQLLLLAACSTAGELMGHIPVRKLLPFVSSTFSIYTYVVPTSLTYPTKGKVDMEYWEIFVCKIFLCAIFVQLIFVALFLPRKFLKNETCPIIAC